MNSHCSFNRLSNRVVQPFWQPAVYTIQPVLKPGLTTSWMYVYTIQPVVKPVWQPVFLCIQTFNWLSNGFDNRFDNRLYRVNGAWVTYHGYASTHHAQSVYAKFEVSMASPVQLSKVWWGPQNLKLGHHLTLTTPIWYVVVSMLILDMGGLPVTKFENSSFSHYTAMNELTQSLKIGMICDSWGY